MMDINQLTGEIIGAAIEVHKTLGPGLLESAYEECLCRELSLRGFSYERQKEVPVSTLFPDFLSQKTRRMLSNKGCKHCS